MSKHDNHELILVINVGSTSTKLGIYRDDEELNRKSFRYDSSYLEQNFATVYDQEELRMRNIRDFLDECGILPGDLTVVVTRGAIVRPTPSGCLEVTDALVEDARRFGGFHPVALGVRLALDFAREAGVACYTVDPQRSTSCLTWPAYRVFRKSSVKFSISLLINAARLSDGVVKQVMCIRRSTSLSPTWEEAPRWGLIIMDE